MPNEKKLRVYDRFHTICNVSATDSLFPVSQNHIIFERCEPKMKLVQRHILHFINMEGSFFKLEALWKFLQWISCRIWGLGALEYGKGLTNRILEHNDNYSSNVDVETWNISVIN